MKNVFKTLAVALTALMVVSCGGDEASIAESDVSTAEVEVSTEDLLVGPWKVDPSSLDLTLGDGLAAFKGAIEEEKGKMLSEASGESDKVTFEFKEDGKLVLSHEDEDETYSFDWSLEGDKLVIKENQTIILRNQGILKINSEHLFSTTERADIYIDIKLESS